MFQTPISVPPQVIPFDFGDDPLVAGDQVNLQCTSNKGDMPILFQWSYQSTDLGTGTHSGVRITKLGPRTSVLMITELDPNIHLGAYTCSAKSIAGSSNYTALLKEIMSSLNI